MWHLDPLYEGSDYEQLFLPVLLGRQGTWQVHLEGIMLGTTGKVVHHHGNPEKRGKDYFKRISTQRLTVLNDGAIT